MKKQDAFGHAVTINYRGDEMYKTSWGALLTLTQKIFILVVTMLGVIDLFNYRGPNITQYRIFDKRTDDTVLNFEENFGGFFFGLPNQYDVNLPLDPRYGHFSLLFGELKDDVYTSTELSVDEYNKENFPDDFE